MRNGFQPIARSSDGQVYAGVTYTMYPHDESNTAWYFESADGQWLVNTSLAPAPVNVYESADPASSATIQLISGTDGSTQQGYLADGTYTVVGFNGTEYFVQVAVSIGGSGETNVSSAYDTWVATQPAGTATPESWIQSFNSAPTPDLSTLTFKV